MTEFRCELLSADQLAAFAAGPLPPGIPAGDARRSMHRDLYLDTPDDSLRRRGVVCRLRIVDAPVQTADVAAAFASDNPVARRVRGIVDPSLLQVRADLEVDRLTRGASLDWLRRPRLTVHLDRVIVRRNGASAGFFQMCAHQLRGKPND